MKITKYIALILGLSLCIGLLTACNDTPISTGATTEETVEEGISATDTTEHFDGNLDGICDYCEAKLGDVVCDVHQDDNEDGVCDICQTIFDQNCTAHEDANGDQVCDICHYDFSICEEHLDSDDDSRCDSCGERLYDTCEHVDEDEDFACDKCLFAL